MAKKTEKAESRIAENRKARFDYFIEDRLEAGIALQGWEVKSMRAGKAQLVDSYVIIRDGEAWLLNSHLTPLNTASTHVTAEPKRSIGARTASRSRSGWPRARSSTTNATRKRTAIGSATRRVRSSRTEQVRRTALHRCPTALNW
jgi:hypothetical protein